MSKAFPFIKLNNGKILCCKISKKAYYLLKTELLNSYPNFKYMFDKDLITYEYDNETPINCMISCSISYDFTDIDDDYKILKNFYDSVWAINL